MKNWLMAVASVVILTGCDTYRGGTGDTTFGTSRTTSSPGVSTTGSGGLNSDRSTGSRMSGTGGSLGTGEAGVDAGPAPAMRNGVNRSGQR